MMADLPEKALPKRGARYVCMEGADKLPNGCYGTNVKLKSAIDRDKGMMIAHAINGGMLRPDHGKPDSIKSDWRTGEYAHHICLRTYEHAFLSGLEQMRAGTATSVFSLHAIGIRSAPLLPCQSPLRTRLPSQVPSLELLPSLRAELESCESD